MIARAAFNKKNKRLYLLSYEIDNGFNPFVTIYHDYPNNQFFKGATKIIDLGILAQAEGICNLENGKLLISQEKENAPKAFTYIFDSNKWDKGLQRLSK